MSDMGDMKFTTAGDMMKQLEPESARVVNYALVLATEAETKLYNRARTQDGLPNDLRYLEKDPLAIKERSASRSLRYDHMHLSVPDTSRELVQWWGRASNGYHYPVGRVMRIIEEKH